MERPLDDIALNLLEQLIAVPSFSREEDMTAGILAGFFAQFDVPVERKGNNVWAKNRFFDRNKPTILLNSHHDTVRPNPGYTRDPFKAEISEGKLYGLGSNDAGGPLVALIAAFLHYYDHTDLPFNLVMAATAEEEVSGTEGIESVLPLLPPVEFAIVGEPTCCEMAIAEKGLMVLDCMSVGKPGHAAREEGVNAIYEALTDIDWFRTYQFPRISPMLGSVKMTVTVINAGRQHNVVPSECAFTVDVRATDQYTLEEILETIQHHVRCQVRPRSMRMRPSGIDPGHVLIKAAENLKIRQYGSPTTSDQALIPAPSVKIGPGDSARSHSADEFIYIAEIVQGIDTYIAVLNEVKKSLSV